MAEISARRPVRFRPPRGRRDRRALGGAHRDEEPDHAEQLDLTTCVLHFSGADFRCGVRRYDADRSVRTAERLFESFNRLSLAQVVREIDREFPGREYTLRDLFLDERREVAGRLLQETMAAVRRRLSTDSTTPTAGSSTSSREIDSPVPRPLQSPRTWP